MGQDFCGVEGFRGRAKNSEIDRLTWNDDSILCVYEFGILHEGSVCVSCRLLRCSYSHDTRLRGGHKATMQREAGGRFTGQKRSEPLLVEPRRRLNGGLASNFGGFGALGPLGPLGGALVGRCSGSFSSTSGHRLSLFCLFRRIK